MKTVVSGLVVMAGLCLCGCSSYRFEGHAANGACTSEPCAMKYWIGPVVLRVNRQSRLDGKIEGDPWAIVQAAEEVGEVRLRRDAMKRHPNLFAHQGNGIPLAVTIRVYGVRKDMLWSALVPVATLGLGPFWIGTSNPCEVTVAIVGERDISQSCALQFRSDVKLSVLSPLGMVPFDSVPGATSCRKGSGLMTAPILDYQCQADWEAVFVETVVDGIEVCIREIEKRTPPDVLARLADAE